MKIDIRNEIAAYKEEVEHQLQVLTNLSLAFTPFQTIEFTLQECQNLDLELFNNHYHVVYLIQIKDFGSSKNGTDFCSCIKKIKNTSKFKLPKVNSENEKSNILYLGKSTGLFKTRLEQHFKGVSEKTYALHLCRWQDRKELKEMKFTMFYSSIDFEKFGIHTRQEQKDLLELIETSLHRKYKPLLGRTGH